RTQSSSEGSPSLYKLHWSFFYDNIPPPRSVADLPENLWALQHVMHPKELIKFNKGFFKAIYDMDTVTTVFSHGSKTTLCSDSKCHAKEYIIPDQLAYLGHYKGYCDAACMKKQFVEESSFKNIRSKVQEAVNRAMKTIGLSLQTEDLQQFRD
ncbi:unnamed protein product, partial [Meganyctiphanes norvegica]